MWTPSFRLACHWLAKSHAIFAELNDRLGAIWVLGAYQLLLATAGHLESALCVRSSFYALFRIPADRAAGLGVLRGADSALDPDCCHLNDVAHRLIGNAVFREVVLLA